MRGWTNEELYTHTNYSRVSVSVLPGNMRQVIAGDVVRSERVRAVCCGES